MKKNLANKSGLEFKCHLAGWILFIVCALCFIASSLKNGDMLAFIGSIIFLAACLVFVLPLVKSIPKDHGQSID